MNASLCLINLGVVLSHTIWILHTSEKLGSWTNWIGMVKPHWANGSMTVKSVTDGKHPHAVSNAAQTPSMVS